MDSKHELIYGCMGLGGEWNDSPLTSEDQKEANAAIEAALEIGITTFDHADIYKLGKSEKVFGNFLKANKGLRSKIKVQSKAGIRYHQALYNSSYYDLSESYLLEKTDEILSRLQTDYLDAFLLHRPDVLMEPQEIASAFDKLKKTGRVKRFGVSNMSWQQIDQLKNCCDVPIEINQVQLSLGHSLPLETGVLVNKENKWDFNGVEGLLEYMQINDIEIQTWGSMDRGRYTGNEQLAGYQEKKVMALLRQLSEKYEVDPSALLLAWLFRIPGDLKPIIGTSDPRRIIACKEAAGIELSREDWYNMWIVSRGERLP